MKKFLALVTFSVLAMSTFAKDFNGNLAISLNGSEPTTTEATISLNETADGSNLYSIVLNNFSFGTYVIGDVTMTDVQGTPTADGKVTFSTEQDATITNGSSIAGLLGGKVHVKIEDGSFLYGEQLHLVISLPVSLLGTTINVSAVFDNATDAISSKEVANEGQNTVKEVFDAAGHRLNGMQKGLNILRQANGTTVKVMKK